VTREAALFDLKGNRKYLNGPERKAYFQAVKDEPDRLRRAFCLTLFYTGCRISEALNLTAERIDLTGKALVFETLKRRKRGYFRSVPIPDSLTELFRQLQSGLEPPAGIWTFSRTTAYRLVKNRMARAGIVGGMACPKGLRHGHSPHHRPKMAWPCPAGDDGNLPGRERRRGTGTCQTPVVGG
jgi:integrase